MWVQCSQFIDGFRTDAEHLHLSQAFRRVRHSSEMFSAILRLRYGCAVGIGTAFRRKPRKGRMGVDGKYRFLSALRISWMWRCSTWNESTSPAQTVEDRLR